MTIARGGKSETPSRPIDANSPAALLSRRGAIGATAVGAALLPGAGNALARGLVDAIAFDAFPIFDPRPVAQKVVALVPDHGLQLAQAWSTKLFGNSWLYAAAGQYATVDDVADNALRYAAESLGLTLSASDRQMLVSAYSSLDAWPDSRLALVRLREAGIRLAFLSNLGEAALRANIARNGLDALFDHVLSTDRVRAFKPSPTAYTMAPEAFGLPKSRIGFAALGGWDAAGAAWFGYRTAWVNRLGVPFEHLGPGPAIAGSDMTAVLRLAGLA
jgi:2-haloacid dehalogenase